MNRGYNEAVTRWACAVVGIARQLDWGESVDVVSRSVLSAWIAVLAVGAAVCSMPILADEATIAGRTFVLPDGFTIELVAAASPLVDRPIAASFDERGRLYVTDSSGSNEKVQTQLKKRPHRIVQLEAVLQLVKGGDLKRGHHLFRSAKAACRSCHSFGYLGGEVGPDLTYIGRIRTERDLLEAILFPSASFVRTYETTVAVKTDGSALSGVVRDRTDRELVLALDAQKVVRIPLTEIAELREGEVSVMPAELDKQFSPQELAELVAFLKAAQ